MGKYKYRAMNSNNEKIEGKYEAKSQQEVMDFITANGLYPLMVEEFVGSKEIKFGTNKRVKIRDISVMCRQFYTMLNAGVPILECLSILSEQIENNKLRQTIGQVEADVNKGGILSECMKKHSKVFPELLTSLIASGEASGKLDSVMLRMADFYEKQNKTANKVKSAMIYPCVLAFVAVVAITGILVFVMPTFVGIFENSGAKLPWNTRLLLWLSESIQEYWYIISIVLAGLIWGGKYYFATEKGKVVSSRIQLEMPVMKKLNQMNIVSQFTRTLSTLIASGLPLLNALDIVTDVIENEIAKSALIGVKEKISRGEGLYSSIQEAGIFPSMLCSMVKIGEETGSLDDILGKTADFYDEELDTIIQSTVALMEPVLIVVMGFAIGFMVMSIMLPMFDMYGQI